MNKTLLEPLMSRRARAAHYYQAPMWSLTCAWCVACTTARHVCTENWKHVKYAERHTICRYGLCHSRYSQACARRHPAHGNWYVHTYQHSTGDEQESVPQQTQKDTSLAVHLLPEQLHTLGQVWDKFLLPGQPRCVKAPPKTLPCMHA